VSFSSSALSVFLPAASAKTSATRDSNASALEAAVSLTVEGQYQNLRRFIRDLEVSKQFIIVNTIELERATETNSAASLDPATNTARNSLVSLRLDLATYFQMGTAEPGQ
jgi:Tfp pilus assembly protein PilO